MTNGRVWRLYEREKSSAGGIYYEANLEAILSQATPEQFKYFYLFFRRAAFLPGAAGITFLEKVFQGSIDYATEVGDRLKDSVYDALRLLMNGFFEHAANGLDRNDPATLALVHENSLIVLYRLLFLLYAEDRDLLPRRSEPYASYSLYRLQREINQHLREGKTFLAAGRRFWGELTNLCELIDGGFEERRNPGLQRRLVQSRAVSAPGAHAQPEHRRWDIGDRFLAEAIDRLAYERERWDEPGTSDVDYATLEVQHLGSIYEGLLELQPHVAAEPLVEQLEDGKPVFKPASRCRTRDPCAGQPPRTVAHGRGLLGDATAGERKATGSYYTPKYIVDYIVAEHGRAVGRERRQQSGQAASEGRRADRTLGAEAAAVRAEGQAGQCGGGRRNIDGIDRQIDEQKQRLLEPYLSLRVLDPAMGSGHFLVGAADFLSMAMATDPNLLPPAAAARRAASILQAARG